MADPVNINQVPKLNLGLQETDEVFITRQGSGPYRVPASSFPWEQKGDKGDPGGSWAPVLALVTDGVRLVHRVVDWVGGTGEKPTALGYVGATGFVATAAAAVDVRGAQGAAGWAPVLAVVEDGVRRVHQVVDWTGGAGTKPTTLGYVGATGIVETAAAAVDVRGPQGVAGWAPVLAVVADGERRVQQVVDWTGGAGDKPATLGYVGAAGIVATAAAAVDVRGAQGVAGWAPVLAVVADGARRVQQVVDWTGGAGDKPATLGYVGAAGIVATAAAAVDVRGAQGVAGWAPVLAVVADGERRVQQIVDWVGGAGDKPATLGYVGATGIVATAAAAVDVRGAQGGVNAVAILESLQDAPEETRQEISYWVAGALSHGLASSLAALASERPALANLAALRTALAAGTATIAFAGDSNTEDGDNIDRARNLLGTHRQVFEDILNDYFPVANITCLNFGLGSRSLPNFASSLYAGQSGAEDKATGFLRTAETHPYWGGGNGSVAGKSWINHVRDSAPDAVVLHFGLNPSLDANFFDALDAVRTAMAGWAKVPSVIIVAPMRPNPLYQDQYRPQRLGRLIRTYARRYGWALVDTHRVHNALRDGMDEQLGHWRYHGQNNLQWSADWVLHSGNVTAPDPATRVFGANSWLSLPIDAHDVQVQITLDARNTATTGVPQVRIRDESHLSQPGIVPQYMWAQQTGFSMKIYDGVAEVGTHSVNAADGDSLIFKAVGPRLELYRRAVGATAWNRVISALSWRNNAGGRIMVGSFGGTVGGLVLRNPRVQYREPLIFPASYSDEYFTGAYNGGTLQSDMPYGGNGVNHPSSRGSARLFALAYRPVIQALLS